MSRKKAKKAKAEWEDMGTKPAHVTPAAVQDDWGCDYCRNDGKLTADGRCPKCDAQYFDEQEG